MQAVGGYAACYVSAVVLSWFWVIGLQPLRYLREMLQMIAHSFVQSFRPSLVRAMAARGSTAQTRSNCVMISYCHMTDQISCLL